MKPESLTRLASKLKSLPGITKKQSEKLAYHLVINDKNEVKDLLKNIEEAIHKIVYCKICHSLSDSQECNICLDKNRNKTLIIVETPLDVFKFEETLNEKPKYHVIGGLINVSKKSNTEDIFVSTLEERAKNFNEIILALSPNLEGIVTANYIKNLLSKSKVTQLAQGIPLGAAMEYVDDLTLKLAMKNRKDVK